MASKCTIEFSRFQPLSAASSLLNYSLQVHIWVVLILVCKCISKLAWLWPYRASLHSQDCHLQVCLCVHSCTACSQSCRAVWRLVLATVPNPRFSSGSGLEPNWNRCNRLYPIKKPNRTEFAVFWLVAQFGKLRTLAPIKYLSSDRITIWYIRKRCSFACSFTSCSPLCDPINIHWVAVKSHRKLGVFGSDATNIDWITKWRLGGVRACKTASFTYISYCDTIRTQILNWSQSAEFTKMRLCCI